MIEGKLYEYQFGLISRRWNAFLGYLLVNGLMLNLLSYSANGETGIAEFLVLGVSLGALAVSALFLQLIDLMTRRVIQTHRTILGYGLPRIVLGVEPNSSRLRSSTGLLYLIISALAVPWVFAVWAIVGRVGSRSLQITICLGIVLLYCINLGLLTWPGSEAVIETDEGDRS